jgi:hypothetical protein
MSTGKVIVKKDVSAHAVDDGAAVATPFERLYFFVCTGLDDPLTNTMLIAWKRAVLMAIKQFRIVSRYHSKYFLFLVDVTTEEQGYIADDICLDNVDETGLDDDLLTEIECNLVIHQTTEVGGDDERIGFVACRLDRFALIAIVDHHIMFPSITDPCWDVDAFIHRYDAVSVIGGKVEVKHRNRFFVRVWKLNNEPLFFGCKKCKGQYKGFYNSKRCAATCRLKKKEIKEPSMVEIWDELDTTNRSIVVELVAKTGSWERLRRILKYPLRRLDADAQILATSMLKIDAKISSRGIASMVDRGREGTTTTGDDWANSIGILPSMDENALFNAAAMLAHEIYIFAHDAYVETKHVLAQTVAETLLLEEETLKRREESRKHKKALRKKKRHHISKEEERSSDTSVSTTTTTTHSSVKIEIIMKDESDDDDELERGTVKSVPSMEPGPWVHPKKKKVKKKKKKKKVDDSNTCPTMRLNPLAKEFRPNAVEQDCMYAQCPEEEDESAYPHPLDFLPFNDAFHQPPSLHAESFYFPPYEPCSYYYPFYQQEPSSVFSPYY